MTVFAKPVAGQPRNASPTEVGVVSALIDAVDNRIPVGLTGAVNPARFVGGTASGAPVAGTFEAGDFVVDETGVIWVCTIGGTPGTWVDTASGRTLDYVESLVNFDATAGSTVDVTGMALSFTARSRPYLLEFHVPQATITAGATGAFTAYISDASNNHLAQATKWFLTTNGQFQDFTFRRRFAASPGAKSYKVRVAAFAGDSIRFDAQSGAGGTNVGAPFFFAAYEV